MGARAASKAAAFDEANFAARWRDYYGNFVGHPGGRQRTPERRHDTDDRRLSAHG
jgi:hypothetical protein